MSNQFLFVNILVSAATSCALLAQTPPAAPTFEVASIRPAAPFDPSMIARGQLHMGLSIDAARVDIASLSMADLIRIAYRIKPHQLSGPDWMSSVRFDVLAKIPEGASRDQVPEMLQTLLAERFKLTMHRESKEHPMYALVVGKSGPKMKEAPPDDPAPEAAPAPAPPAGSGERGALVFRAGDSQMHVSQSSDGKGATLAGGPMGRMKMAMGEGGAMRMEFAKMTMPLLAETLTRFAGRPVVDMTGLKGTYQVELELSMEEMRNIARSSGMVMVGGPGGGPAATDSSRAPADAASTPSGNSVFTAVQKLGLRLESRKDAVETIVIDHLEKAPTEN